MVRLPLRDIEEALSDPVKYQIKMTSAGQGTYSYSYFNAILNSITAFHKEDGNSLVAIDYLEDQLEKFKNKQRCADTMNQLFWYMEEYHQRGWHTFRTRLNIKISLPPWMPTDFRCSGQVSRIDLIPSGGYAAWLMRSRNFEGWSNESRMPLVQNEIAANVLKVPLSEVRIGIYSFQERYVEDKCFDEDEIEKAYDQLESLLHQMGYP